MKAIHAPLQHVCAQAGACRWRRGEPSPGAPLVSARPFSPPQPLTRSSAHLIMGQTRQCTPAITARSHSPCSDSGGTSENVAFFLLPDPSVPVAWAELGRAVPTDAGWAHWWWGSRGCPALWASGVQESLSPAKPLRGWGRGRAGGSGTHGPAGSRVHLPQAGPVPRAASWAQEPSAVTCASVFGLTLEGAGSGSVCTSPLFLPYPV